MAYRVPAINQPVQGRATFRLQPHPHRWRKARFGSASTTKEIQQIQTSWVLQPLADVVAAEGSIRDGPEDRV